MSCGQCDKDVEKEEKKAKYKCRNCGSGYGEPAECCGEPCEKLCECGSGGFGKECCKI